MKIKNLSALLAAAALSLQLASAQNFTNAALDALVKEVTVKIKDGQATEAALAPELARFDSLLAAQNGAKTEGAAQIIYVKAMLYLQIFDNSVKGGELMKKLKDEYGQTRHGESAAKIVEKIALRSTAEKAKAEMETALAPGKIFPDFAEKDLNGKPLSVGALKGKVVLVDFWATWCVPCRIELPNVIAAYKKHHAAGFEIIGVSLDGNRGRLESFLKENTDMAWPQFFEASEDGGPQNWGNKLAVKYGVRGIPFAVLIGADGKVIGSDLGGAALDAAVAKALRK